jgi:predicted nucleic acid-binding protein
MRKGLSELVIDAAACSAALRSVFRVTTSPMTRSERLIRARELIAEGSELCQLIRAHNVEQAVNTLRTLSEQIDDAEERADNFRVSTGVSSG